MYAARGGSFKARQGITSKKKFILLETFRLLILNLIAKHLDYLSFYMHQIHLIQTVIYIQIYSMRL